MTPSGNDYGVVVHRAHSVAASSLAEAIAKARKFKPDWPIGTVTVEFLSTPVPRVRRRKAR